MNHKKPRPVSAFVRQTAIRCHREDNLRVSSLYNGDLISKYKVRCNTTHIQSTPLGSLEGYYGTDTHQLVASSQYKWFHIYISIYIGYSRNKFRETYLVQNSFSLLLYMMASHYMEDKRGRRAGLYELIRQEVSKQLLYIGRMTLRLYLARNGTRAGIESINCIRPTLTNLPYLGVEGVRLT